MLFSPFVNPKRSSYSHPNILSINRNFLNQSSLPIINILLTKHNSCLSCLSSLSGLSCLYYFSSEALPTVSLNDLLVTLCDKAFLAVQDSSIGDLVSQSVSE